MVLVLLAEVLPDDQRGSHVDETRSKSIQDAVSQKKPFQVVDEGGGQSADAQDESANQSSDPVASVAETSDETDRNRSGR